MKNLAFVLLLFIGFTTFSQDMTLTKLGEIIKEAGDNVESGKSRWNFIINQTPLIAIADSTHNRMRIISPIIEIDKLSDELKTASLMANFHTALDIKYAITDNILWSIYVHPLKELTKGQVIDAISQVYYGNVNFGTSFSSTSLVFPGRSRPQEPIKKEEKQEKKLIDKI